jgi:hypothetical protein
MLISLKVPDEVFEAYGAFNPQNPRLAMEQALVRFARVAPNRKAIVLTGEALSEVQKLLSGSFSEADDLLDALRRALMVRVEGVDVALTEGQRKAIGDAIRFNPKIEPREFTEVKIKEGLRVALGV